MNLPQVSPETSVEQKLALYRTGYAQLAATPGSTPESWYHEEGLCKPYSQKLFKGLDTLSLPAVWHWSVSPLHFHVNDGNPDIDIRIILDNTYLQFFKPGTGDYLEKVFIGTMHMMHDLMMANRDRLLEVVWKNNGPSGFIRNVYAKSRPYSRTQSVF